MIGMFFFDAYVFSAESTVFVDVAHCDAGGFVTELRL